MVTTTTEDFSTVTDNSTYLVGETLTLTNMQVKVLLGRTLVDTYDNAFPTGTDQRL